MAKRFFCAEAARVRHSPQRRAGGFQRIFCARYPLVYEPLRGPEPSGVTKLALQGPLAHAGAASQRSQIMLRFQIRSHPLKQRCDRVRGIQRDGVWKKLRLSALTMRRDNETPRDQIRSRRKPCARRSVSIARDGQSVSAQLL